MTLSRGRKLAPQKWGFSRAIESKHPHDMKIRDPAMAPPLAAHAHARDPPLLAAVLNLGMHTTLSATSAVVALQTTIALVTGNAHIAHPRNAAVELPEEEEAVADTQTCPLKRAPKELDLAAIGLVLHLQMPNK